VAAVVVAFVVVASMARMIGIAVVVSVWNRILVWLLAILTRQQQQKGYPVEQAWFQGVYEMELGMIHYRPRKVNRVHRIEWA
jgi:hypothetical protein